MSNHQATIRSLITGGGATFDELLAQGKAGGGTPYSYEELCEISSGSTTATVPPLVFVHVPKAGGTTLNHIFSKNYRFRCDAYGAHFFPRYYPDEFISLVIEPRHDDTRRPAFFTGHIDLSNDIFKYMPTRYVAVTMLRDPVERAISQYRFRATLTGSPLAAEIAAGQLTVAQFMKQDEVRYPPQWRLFGSNLNDAKAALLNRISVFGLQEYFDDFLSSLVSLLGLRDVSYRRLNVTSKSSQRPDQHNIGDLQEYLADDVDFYEHAKSIIASRRIITAAAHPWQNFYA